MLAIQEIPEYFDQPHSHPRGSNIWNLGYGRGTPARDMYSMSLFTVAVVRWLGRVPRVFILCGAAAVMVGVAIAASRSFLSTLSTLVSIAGYMTGPTLCVFLIEWLYFRKADPSKLDPAIWNDAAALPSGIPAIISSLLPWALIVTSMSTGWYVGPIAMRIGDLAYELGTVSAVYCNFHFGC
jgi:hypothetical protein